VVHQLEAVAVKSSRSMVWTWGESCPVSGSM
jgi:hypothetical protein